MKLRFLAGMAAGYLFGTRAGRERYDQLMRSLNEVAESDLFAQARAEVAKLTGKVTPEREVDSGLVATPVIVGPGPDGKTGSANTDMVLPDLESARRLDPPQGG